MCDSCAVDRLPRLNAPRAPSVCDNPKVPIMSAYRTNADDGASYHFSVDLLGGFTAEHLCCLWELLSRRASLRNP